MRRVALVIGSHALLIDNRSDAALQRDGGRGYETAPFDVATARR